MSVVGQQKLVLVVEDDKKTSDLLIAYLARDGFRAVAAYDGQSALRLFAAETPEFVILDLMLPLLDGWEVCQEIRKGSNVPILFLTARDEESDRVLGLGLGGDDYVTKPFSPRELIARVRAILRRGAAAPEAGPGKLSYRGLILDREKRRVTEGGRPLVLTPFEYKLLELLMNAPGRAFGREELLAGLYPRGESVIDRVIDVHIGKLRQKIEADPLQPTYILTVRGVGYRFADGVQ